MNPQQQTQYYQVPDQYAGQTLSQIRNQQNLGFRPDLLASQLGISDQTQLQKGQLLQGNIDTGSGEGIGASKLFGAPVDPVVYRAQQMRNFNLQANQPAIESLQKNIPDLQQRYDDILKSIKGQQDVATNWQTMATNNLMSQRGISNQSPYYQQEMSRGLLPLTQNFQNLTSQQNLQETQQVQAIQNAIAQLQTGNPSESIQAGIKSQELSIQQRQNEIQNALEQQKIANELQLGQLRSQFPVSASDRVYNPMTGQFAGGEQNYSLNKPISNTPTAFNSASPISTAQPNTPINQANSTYDINEALAFNQAPNSSPTYIGGYQPSGLVNALSNPFGALGGILNNAGNSTLNWLANLGG